MVFALKRGTFENEGESDRGELQKARTRKESSAGEKKPRRVSEGVDQRRREKDGGDDRMRESDEKKREKAMEECATERERRRRWLKERETEEKTD